MPNDQGLKKSPRVVICAAVTADGKLADAVPALPPVLYAGGADPARHPWARLYDGAAGILADGEPPGSAGILPALQNVESTKGDVLCFGGAALFRALLEGGWVDELRLIVLPVVDGRRDAPSLSGPGGAGFFPASVACRLVKVETGAEGEGLLHYKVMNGRRRKAVETAGGGEPPSPG